MTSTMRPGVDTGSLTNHLYSRMTKGAPEPEVGMAATLLHWTDRDAATVIAVAGDIIRVQADTAKVISGSTQDGSAKWAFEPNPDGAIYTFRRAKDGGWQPVRLNQATGRWSKVDGSGLILGKRDHYYDPSF